MILGVRLIMSTTRYTYARIGSFSSTQVHDTKPGSKVSRRRADSRVNGHSVGDKKEQLTMTWLFSCVCPCEAPSIELRKYEPY